MAPAPIRPRPRRASASAAALSSALLFGSLALAAPARAQQPGRIVLTHASLVDGARGAWHRDATVVVSGGRIERIETGQVAVPPDAQVIDLQGRYLLPGLIDAHTHIATLDAARRALESGVTTVRSASTPFFQDVGLRELVRSGRVPGPDVVAAGLFVRPGLGESAMADPRLAGLEGVSTAEQLRTLVNVDADRGVDVIKTMATERAGLPNTDPRRQVYTEEQLRVIVEEARRRGLSVMCHAHGDEGALAAVRAGVRSIEHGTYLSEATLALMKERGTFFVPTYTTVVDLVEPGGDYDDPVLHVRGRHMLPRLADAVRRAHRMGVKVVTGADTGYGAESTTRISHEVANFVQLGMTPLDALRSATTVAAELLGIEKKTGALQVGMEADLIAVERNPLEDIAALQDVLVVISNGRVGLNRLPFAREPSRTSTSSR
jgi:imidazolonepropionase-like amidohydrolase